MIERVIILIGQQRTSANIFQHSEIESGRRIFGQGDDKVVANGFLIDQTVGEFTRTVLVNKLTGAYLIPVAAGLSLRFYYV